MQNEKSFDTGELALNYFEGKTSAPPLVLLHGLTANWLTWYPMLPGLQSKWHLYAPDLRGHGKSGRAADNRYDVGSYARDIITFLKQIDEPVVLIGHSLGALTAIAVVAEYPAGVHAAALLDPPLYSWNNSIDIDPGAKQWFQWVYDLKSSSPSMKKLIAECRKRLPSGADVNQAKGMAQILAGVAPGTVEAALGGRLWENIDLAKALEQIQCPTLLIHGDWDRGGAMRADDIAFFQDNCPAAKVVRIPEAGHGIPQEHPDIVLQQLSVLLPST